VDKIRGRAAFSAGPKAHGRPLAESPPGRLQVRSSGVRVLAADDPR
jgi:hypothetical protein